MLTVRSLLLIMLTRISLACDMQKLFSPQCIFQNRLVNLIRVIFSIFLKILWMYPCCVVFSKVWQNFCPPSLSKFLMMMVELIVSDFKNGNSGNYHLTIDHYLTEDVLGQIKRDIVRSSSIYAEHFGVIFEDFKEKIAEASKIARSSPSLSRTLFRPVWFSGKQYLRYRRRVAHKEWQEHYDQLSLYHIIHTRSSTSYIEMLLRNM